MKFFFFFSSHFDPRIDIRIYIIFKKGTIVLIKKRIEIDWAAIQFPFGNTRTSPAQNHTKRDDDFCEVADIEPFQGQSDQIFQFLVEKHPIFFFSFLFFSFLSFFSFLRDRRINERRKRFYKNLNLNFQR